MSQLEIAVVAILFFLVGFRVAVIAVLGLLIVRPVRDCPACFRTTVPVLVKWLPRRSSSFEWRWCPECHWEGPGRKILDRDAVAGVSFRASQST